MEHALPEICHGQRGKSVPCLDIASNVFGILAGAVFMYLRVNISLPNVSALRASAVRLSDVLIGLANSLVFATIIVHVGCMEGFRVRGGPEAVGKSATSAVVKSTLLVIFADLFITAIFYMLGMGA
jgi:phospholipid/cholesterol/gamma-HCH transport system permease protein